MAKKGKKKGRARTRKLSLVTLASFAPLTIKTIEAARTTGITGALNEVSAGLTGYSTNTGKWSITQMRYGMGPIILGALVKKAVGMLGVNRAIGNLKLPIKL